MTDIMRFAVTLAVGVAGGLLFKKLKVPSGAMVGAMFFVVVFNLLTDRGFFYSDIKTGVQIFSGALIGVKVGKDELRELKIIVKPLIFLLLGVVLLNLFFGVVLTRFTVFDVPTALFATAPGGVSDMALISEELGADSSYVAILQVFRLLIIFSFCPPIFKKLMNSGKVKTGAGSSDTAISVKKTDWAKFCLLILVSAVVGMIFYFLKITAGALIGGMVGGALFTIFRGKNKFPINIQTGMQICSGSYLGTRLARDSLKSLDKLILPILIMTVAILAFIFITSWLINRFTDLDFATAMFASTPGGLQEMALLSEEMGADTLKVSVLQTCRLFFVVAFFPTMIKIICKLIG